jgi:putative ABC transport system substrate-binding protein
VLARAQQKAMPVIGFLSSTAPGSRLVAFRQGSSETGYVEGQNVAIEYRSAEGIYDQLPAMAADFVGRKVDVIVAGGTPAALAAKSATQTIPIVFSAIGDPVGIGLVASLAQLGGNVTGISETATELMSKRLELLSELVPQATVVALLMNPTNSNAEPMIRDVEGSGAHEGAAAPYPEGPHRKRDRRRLRRPRPTARRRADRRPRCILQQPARADRRIGIAPCRSGDLSLA